MDYLVHKGRGTCLSLLVFASDSFEGIGMATFHRTNLGYTGYGGRRLYLSESQTLTFDLRLFPMAVVLLSIYDTRRSDKCPQL